MRWDGHGKVSLILLAGIVVTSLPLVAQKRGSRPVIIAGIGKSIHAYWREVELGMMAAARELGNCRVQWFVPPKEDVRVQVSTFESFTAKAVDGIVIGPSNAEAITPVIKRALQKGIPVITFDTDAPESGRLVYIGTDNEKAGYEAGKVMVRLLKGGGKIAICTGSLTALNSLQRMNGFRKAVKGTKVTVVETYNDREDRAVAVANAQTALQRYPDLKGFYGVYAFNGPACAEAVKMADKVGQVVIVCFDATAEHIRLIKEGVISATLAQRPYRMGYLSTQILYQMVTEGVPATLKKWKLDRVPLPKRHIDTGIDVVTAQTIPEFRKRLIDLGIPIEGW